MIFEQKCRVGIEDVDKNNLISPKAVLRLFEDVACFQADTIGQGPIGIDEVGIVWALTNWQIKIVKRSAYGDVVTVRTWPKKFERASCIRDFEIVSDNNEIVAIGTSRWFIMDRVSRRPMRITEEYVKPYLPLSEKSSFDKIDKIKEPTFDEFLYMKEYVVSRRDIDANKHMHNINYLDVALEMIPEEVYEKNKFTNILIEYKKEIMYKENVECYYCEKNGENIVTMKTNDKVNAIISLS